GAFEGVVDALRRARERLRALVVAQDTVELDATQVNGAAGVIALRSRRDLLEAHPPGREAPAPAVGAAVLRQCVAALAQLALERRLSHQLLHRDMGGERGRGDAARLDLALEDVHPCAL